MDSVLLISINELTINQHKNIDSIINILSLNNETSKQTWIVQIGKNNIIQYL